MSSSTIKELTSQVKQQGYAILPGWKGQPLEYTSSNREEVGNNKVDDLYQRTISVLKLNDYDQCDLTLLIPAIISERPEELAEIDRDGRYVIDGQNKEVIFYNATSGKQKEDNIPTMPEMVLKHKYDPTLSLQDNYEKVLKAEAKLFEHLNTLRKKLTKLDELRAEVCQGDGLATDIEDTMITLNLVSDRFGSKESNAKEVKSFSQFYYCLTGDFNNENGVGTSKTTKLLKAGYDLWSAIYPKEEKVHGTAFRAICLIDRFTNEALSNGLQEKFRNWCKEELSKQYSPVKLVKGFGTFESPRWTLHRVIEKYNDMMSNMVGSGAPTIGPKKLVAAAELNKVFVHPDEDEWQRINKRAAVKENSKENS